ncbi:hypothetical protein [Streptomyces mirabilis]
MPEDRLKGITSRQRSLPAHAECVEFGAAFGGELVGSAAGVVEPSSEPDRRGLSAFCRLFDVFAGYVQVSFAGVELAGGGEVGGSPVGCAARGLLRLGGGLDSKDAVQEPLLCGQEFVPAVALRDGPGAEVLALHDHLTRTRRERSAGPQMSVRCAVSREFAVILSSSAWGLGRRFATLGLRVCVQIVMILQEFRRTIVIRTDPPSPSARPTCGNWR